MKDVLKKWNLNVLDNNDKLYVEKLLNDSAGLTIILKKEKSDKKYLKIFFDDTLSYRNTNESFLLKIWHTTQKENLGKTFYSVENSSYIDFFHEMTQKIYLDWDIIHYAIYTISECIDILSQVPPVISWEEE
ncbi:MAG: hypothetical protein Aureis2KO_01470 [Aureisphaera sp.]